MDAPDTPTGRRVIVSRPGEEHNLAVLPDALPSWKEQGYEPTVWEDTREPYKAPKAERAVPRVEAKAEKG